MGKKLAIKGHPTRGKEVIELLEMMGGTNPFSHNGMAIGNKETNCYYISENTVTKYISWDCLSSEEINKYEIFTLEGFLKEYPFKIGDKVIDGCGNKLIIKAMSWSEDCRTMVYDFEDSAIVLAAEDIEFVDDNKLSGTVGNNSIDASQFMQLGKIAAVCFNTTNYENEVELKLDDYEIVVRNGKTYAVLKKPAYPTTYEECCKIMCVELWNTLWGEDATEYEKQTEDLINALIKLKVCRDAYWEIAGEEMGLDGPWEPNWIESSPKYTITVIENKFEKRFALTQSYILAFPTEEMRDIFYENFKDLIEQCKELL